MPECPILKTCPFFNDKLLNVPICLDVYKKSCCLDENLRCARFVVARFLGISSVPYELLPNEMDKAEEIINNHGK
ncbi:hypothetical protein GOM49_06990 [Clostridium bovifaecis]|uniref:Uncharacterized protein n=1 Tax=Clostridium bovifaecis TaxID=2184719 RepID=A0A6I6ERQ9_9CLOT|nr:hypothetical protein GOM49_06990 [Clostridium bovifaecis]